MRVHSKGHASNIPSQSKAIVHHYIPYLIRSTYHHSVDMFQHEAKQFVVARVQGDHFAISN